MHGRLALSVGWRSIPESARQSWQHRSKPPRPKLNGVGLFLKQAVWYVATQLRGINNVGNAPLRVFDEAGSVRTEQESSQTMLVGMLKPRGGSCVPVDRDVRFTNPLF